MCFLTVCGETTRIAAISLVVLPSAIHLRISVSLRVSGDDSGPFSRSLAVAAACILINAGLRSSSRERSRSVKSRLLRSR